MGLQSPLSEAREGDAGRTLMSWGGHPRFVMSKSEKSAPLPHPSIRGFLKGFFVSAACYFLWIFYYISNFPEINIFHYIINFFEINKLVDEIILIIIIPGIYMCGIIWGLTRSKSTSFTIGMLILPLIHILFFLIIIYIFLLPSATPWYWINGMQSTLSMPSLWNGPLNALYFWDIHPMVLSTNPLIRLLIDYTVLWLSDFSTSSIIKTVIWNHLYDILWLKLLKHGVLSVKKVLIMKIDLLMLK